MRKRIVALLMVLVFTMSGVLTGCGGDNSNGWNLLGNTEAPLTNAETEATDAPESTTPESIAPETEATVAPDTSAKPTYVPTDGKTVVTLKVGKDLNYGNDFDAFLDAVFIVLTTSDYPTLHFKLEHPENYGIKMNYTFGDETPEELNARVFKFVRDGLAKFDYASLNDRQKLKYDLLKYECDMETKGEKFKPYVCRYLSQNGNVLNDAQSLFTEYPILSEKDAKDFVELLKILPDYINSLMTHIKKSVVEDKALLTQAMLDQAKGFVRDWQPSDTTKNAIYVAFAENAKEGKLSQSEIDGYLKQIKDILEGKVNPAIKNFDAMLDGFKSEVDEAKGLSNFDGGKDFYSYLLESYLGTGKSVDDVYKYVGKRYVGMRERVKTIVTEHGDSYKKYSAGNIKSKYGNDPLKVFEGLMENAYKTFPNLGKVDYQISYLNDNQKVSGVTAYYLSPQLDNVGRRIIRMNGDNISNSVELFATLSHEGLPGHLYQDEFRFNSPYFDEMDTCLTYLGYQEGWAMYVEKLAHGWCIDDQYVAELTHINTMLSYVMISITDIATNYYGKTKADIGAWYSKEYGHDMTGYIAGIYGMTVSDPALYPAYGIGYLLMEDTVNALIAKGLSEGEAYKKILDIGSVPYSILWERLGIENPIDVVNAEE